MSKVFTMTWYAACIGAGILISSALVFPKPSPLPDDEAIPVFYVVPYDTETAPTVRMQNCLPDDCGGWAMGRDGVVVRSDVETVQFDISGEWEVTKGWKVVSGSSMYGVEGAHCGPFTSRGAADAAAAPRARRHGGWIGWATAYCQQNCDYGYWQALMDGEFREAKRTLRRPPCGG